MPSIKSKKNPILALLCILSTANNFSSTTSIKKAEAYAPPLKILPSIQHIKYPNNFVVNPKQKKIDSSSTKLKKESPSIKPKKKPKGYWKNLGNIDLELRQFWSGLEVPISPSNPVPIPNESLLNHFRRNDLRHAIYVIGGREVLSVMMNCAPVIPGKWTEAVKTREVKMLLKRQNDGSSSYGLLKGIPPISPQVKKKMLSRGGANAGEGDNNVRSVDSPNKDDDVITEANRFRENKRWTHRQDRKKKGHWNQELVITELRSFLQGFKRKHNRPSVWMPRMSELASKRSDLHSAIYRFGGPSTICKKAGLIPHREWHFFENQYQFYSDLHQYLLKCRHGRFDYFPRASELKQNGAAHLIPKIQLFGGRKQLASKLHMKLTTTGKASSAAEIYLDCQWGAFSLEFALDLLGFVREDMMKMSSPVVKPLVQMPSREKLMSSTVGIELDKKIEEYGGYESVARRLGLYFEMDQEH